MSKTAIIFAILCSSSLFSQKKLNLEQCTKLASSFVTTDSSLTYTLKGISKMKIVIHTRSSEVFEISDTTNRDFIQISETKLTLDRLYGLNQADYTGSYDLMDCYSIVTSDYSYCILPFVDVFILGSNQQVLFVIVRQTGDGWEYDGSYTSEHNMPMDDIRIIKKKNRIKLKGKYLKQIKSV